jgi:hypothetical protein
MVLVRVMKEMTAMSLMPWMSRLVFVISLLRFRMSVSFLLYVM